MTNRHPAFFESTEMPTAGWWPALWPRSRRPAEIVEPAQSNLFELESDRGRPRYSLNTVFNRAVASLRVARAAASLFKERKQIDTSSAP